LKAWIDLGAEPSPVVESLMGQVAPDVLRAFHERKIVKRQKRAVARRRVGGAA